MCKITNTLENDLEPLRPKRNAKCFICKSKHRISLHHVKPRAEGGKNDERNLVPLCSICHDYVEGMEWPEVLKFKFLAANKRTWSKKQKRGIWGKDDETVFCKLHIDYEDHETVPGMRALVSSKPKVAKVLFKEVPVCKLGQDESKDSIGKPKRTHLSQYQVHDANCSYCKPRYWREMR